MTTTEEQSILADIGDIADRLEQIDNKLHAVAEHFRKQSWWRSLLYLLLKIACLSIALGLAGAPHWTWWMAFTLIVVLGLEKEMPS